MSSQDLPPFICDAAAQVVANTQICREHYHLELRVPKLPRSSAGQFLQIRCASENGLAGRHENNLGGLGDNSARQGEAFLRRPFSIADRWTGSDGTPHLLVIHRAIGPGTSWLARLRPHEIVSITGPLGRGFQVGHAASHVVLVGGGVGIPPLLYAVRQLWREGAGGITAILGARTREFLPVRILAEPDKAGEPTACVEYPGSAAVPTIVTTDDGSLGMRGQVTGALRTWHAQSGGAAAGALVLACGPEGMLRAVAELTRELGLGCQLCIERMMGCGLGTCLSCVVRVRDGSRIEGWRFALTCREGPVFERDHVFLA